MSKTKEEIIKSTIGLIPFINHFSAEEPAKLVYKAMEEYALQEMGSFAEWMAETGLYLVKFNDPYYWTIDIKEHDGKYSTKQVVELYYESIK
jgi:hypothetical protein